MIGRAVVSLCLFVVFSLSAFAEDSRPEQLLGGKVTVTLPAGLVLMSEEMKKVKYPTGNPPAEVFTNEQGTVNVAVNAGAYPGKHELSALVPAMASSLDKAGSISKWHNKGTRDINGRQFGVLEFTSKATDTEIYNQIYFTKRDGELVVFTVNATVGLLDEWRAKLDAVVASTRLN